VDPLFSELLTLDVPEIFGELTARARLVVPETGRVSATIRYGKLMVAEGGDLSGDVGQLDGSSALLRPLSVVESDSRPGSGPTVERHAGAERKRFVSAARR
jgi:hypothetical protein